MKHIILHIGMPKTGSTALQKFFCSNFRNNRGAWVKYYEPKRRCFPLRRYANGDYFLFKPFEILGIELDAERKIKLSKEKDRILEQLSYHDTLLFSDEILWEWGFLHERFFEALREIITDLFGKETDIRIVLYLRRQDEWIFSYWKQRTMIRSYYAKEQFKEFLSEARKRGMLDYARMVTNLEKAFGSENLVVRVYERDVFIDGDICRDFMNAVDIPHPEYCVSASSRTNPSITLQAAEAAVLINNEGMGDVERNDTIAALRLFSEMYPEEERYYPLPYDERLKIIEMFREGNQYISDKYFSGEQLFSKEIEPYIVREYDEERASRNAELILKMSKISPETRQMIKRVRNKK